MKHINMKWYIVQNLKEKHLALQLLCMGVHSDQDDNKTAQIHNTVEEELHKTEHFKDTFKNRD